MKITGRIKGLLGGLVMVAAVCGCKQGKEDAHSLAFKQKQADAYLQFLASHPDSAGLRLLTAQKLDSVGRYKDALAQMDTLLREDSTKYGLWVVQGKILLDSTDTSAAETAFNRALVRYKGEEALLAQGAIYAVQKRDTCLVIADELAFGSPVYSNYIKGLFAAQKMDSVNALAYLDKSIHEDPAFAEAYVAKAKLLLKTGQLPAARATVLEGLKHNQASIDLLNTSGAVYEALQQKDSARHYYQQSLLIKPFQKSIQQKLSAT